MFQHKSSEVINQSNKSKETDLAFYAITSEFKFMHLT